MTFRARRTVYTSMAVAAAATLGATPSATAIDTRAGSVLRIAEPGATERPDDVLRRPANGATALDRLGDDRGKVAALNKMSPTALEHLLLTDETVWVHPSGLLYYVDALPDGLDDHDHHEDTDHSLEVAGAPYPYSQTFQLHSKPGSSRTIYLDFNGEYVSGTAWNDVPDYALGAQTHPAFSLDGDPTTFSNAEQDAIQSIWQRVSEDYAPFDVDVTTADPGLAILRRTDPTDLVYGTRALITPSGPAANKLCGSNCGGVAFMGTFDMPGTDLGVAGSDYAQPAWVFPHLLANDTKAIAEAISHEVGHNVGLDHDGTASVGYFGGHGAWAPIMGDSYGRPISQWSAGEYSGAVLPSPSPQTNPDDLTVITQNGLPFQADDHGDSTGSATSLSPTVTEEGLIATRDDKDYFAIPQSCSGNVTISVTPAPTSPNLDVRLRILSDDGTVVATDNPASGAFDGDVATGMDASATAPATSGSTLYAEVDGVGAGNPATNGYSDYASLGRYTITSTDCSEATPVQPDLLISTSAKGGYIGDDIYNTSGAQQSKQLSGKRGAVRSFFVRLTNDGTTTDQFVLTAGKAPKGAKVTYFSGRNDITEFLTGGGGLVEMHPDQFAVVEVRIKPGRKAKFGSTKSVLLTAISQGGGQLDAVKAGVRVKR